MRVLADAEWLAAIQPVGDDTELTMAERTWADDIKQISSSADRARGILGTLHQLLHEHIVTSDVPDRRMARSIESQLGHLRAEIEYICYSTEQVFSRLMWEPFSKLLAGHPLTREEYNLLAASGGIYWQQTTTKELGISPVDDFEAFSFLHYEDEESRSYINIGVYPDEDREATRPTSGSGRLPPLRFGIPPEEVHVRSLRPEQREFFARHLPGVYARFTRD